MSAYISTTLKRRVRTRFSNYCAYCHSPEVLTVSTFEIEHIVPLSVGGKTEFENLCLACPTCNRHKAFRQMAFDSSTGETVPLFNPQRQEWVEHFVWNETFTEIIGLTAVGRATISALKMNRIQLIRVRQMWVKMEKFPSLIEF